MSDVCHTTSPPSSSRSRLPTTQYASRSCDLLPGRALPREFDLLEMLLTEQRSLEAQQPTAVEQFSQWHSTSEAPGHPAQSRYYKDLIPATLPQPGEQLAFQVDLDLCSGCKACVVACHTLNGLDDGESFRDVGLLIGDNDSLMVQHVTTACHHCVDPGCLNACPVNAYEKDPVTGIVRHLDDQCFGCQYCTLACPYHVPRYQAARGIVRKCDMCSQRLAAGAAPACVQACPHQAISIQIVSVADQITRAAAGQFLADSPDPCVTQPTTVFKGQAAVLPELRETRLHPESLEHAHPPLILLLLLSQMSVGIVTGSAVLAWTLPEAAVSGGLTGVLIVAAATALLSAIASTLHLGRPQFAFRAILGLRHSWLSREILAFGIYIPLTFATVLCSLSRPELLPWLLPGVAITGITGVACSAMIYHITRRPYWNGIRSGLSFFSGSAGMAAAVLIVALTAAGGVRPSVVPLLAVIGCLSVLGRVIFTVQSMHWRDTATHSSRTLATTTQRLRGQLKIPAASLLMASMIGGLSSGWMALSPMLSLSPVLGPMAPYAAWLAVTAAVAVIIAEAIDRYLFFRAVVPLHMPGVVR